MPDARPAPDEILEPPAPALVLCPLGFERRALLRFGKLPVVTTGPGAEAIRRAFAARERWPVPNPSLLILFGLAGGINPSITVGCALVDASTLAAFDPSGTRRARFVETRAPISTPEDKARLRTATGADAVDTESAAFVECAREARIPFAIVRGVGDAAGDTLPAEVARFVDAQGETRLSRVLGAVVRRPALIRELRRLARDSRTALRDAAFLADAFGALPAIALCSPSHPFLLFGGSFDPPHARHASILVEAMHALGAPCATIMPAAINPLKCATPPAPPEARLALCRAAFREIDGATRGEIRLSRLELDREGPSYTIDTVERLLADHPHLRGAIRFLIGSDAIRSIERWHRWRELLELAQPAVVVRPPDTHAATAQFLAEFAQASGFADAPSWLLDLQPVDLASTGIREAIAQGQWPEGLPDAVFREITTRGLYGSGGAR
ncbi:MAG: nicotinate (nicotinamide) nucleotide adenylyltransferase [bacterium]